MLRSSRLSPVTLDLRVFLISIFGLLTALAGCDKHGAEPVSSNASSSQTQQHRAGAEIYETYCFACHDYGAAGAPRMDSWDQWAARIDSGVSGLRQSVEKGLGVMPKKGSCFDCSHQEMTAVVEYMINQLNGQLRPN